MYLYMYNQFTSDDIKSVADNSFMIFSAARKAGKTHLCSYIVNNLGDRFAQAFVISTTSKLQNSFAFVPPKNHFNPDVDGNFEEYIQRIIDFQIERKESRKTCGQILLIMDDLFVSSSFGIGRYSKTLSKIAATGRHVNIFTILITQRWASISPSIRSQATDYITFLPRSSIERKMLFDQYLSREQGNNKEMHQRVANLIADIFDNHGDYTAMWIQCDNRSSQLNDMVSWIIAPAKLKKWSMVFKSVTNKKHQKLLPYTFNII